MALILQALKYTNLCKEHLTSLDVFLWDWQKDNTCAAVIVKPNQ